MRRLTIISGDRFKASSFVKPEDKFSSVDLSSFITGAELYFASVISSMSDTILQTYEACLSDYRLLILVLFVVFIGLLVLALAVLRKQLIVLMSEDIFKSRGILNLIPNTFFE